MKQNYTLHILILLFLLFISCNSNNNTSYKIKGSSGCTDVQAFNYTPEANFDDGSCKYEYKLSWTKPKFWKENSPSNMVISSFTAHDSYENIATIAISKFAGDVGGREAIEKRWMNQIGLPFEKYSTIINDIKKEDFPLLGKGENGDIFTLINDNKAIMVVMIKQESETIFIKMTGTPDSISELTYEFMIFCKSIHWVN